MNFSQFFVKRPIFAGVLSAIIFIAGLLALYELPVSEYPEVVPPAVTMRPARSAKTRFGSGRKSTCGYSRRNSSL